MTKQVFVMPHVGRETFLANLVKRLAAMPERRWTISIEPYVRHRTTEQNRLLWRLYRDILEIGGEALAGWRVEDLHEYLLGEWGGWQAVQGFGHRHQRPARRSSSLSKQEFSDYLEFICQRMAEHGIILTMPGDLEP
jgi:hypothetical protein